MTNSDFVTRVLFSPYFATLLDIWPFYPSRNASIITTIVCRCDWLGVVRPLSSAGGVLDGKVVVPVPEVVFHNFGHVFDGDNSLLGCEKVH